MSEEYGNAKDASDGAGLWARARPGWRAFASPGEAPGVSGEAPDPLVLAAYLDGALDTAERERVEAWMAAFPEALELMAMARQTLGEGSREPSPEGLILRAQDLVRAPLREPVGLRAWLRGLAGLEIQAWRPVAWAGVTAVLLVVSAGGFELGRLGAERLVSVQNATLGDDLALGLDDPADDFL
jgi:anti-sigma factor RsiW